AHREDDRALAARHALVGLRRGRALRRLCGHPCRAVHVGACDTHRHARARSRPTGCGATALASADSLRMTLPQRPVLFLNPRSGGGKAERAGPPEHARERDIDVVALRSERTLVTLVEG